LLPPGEGDVIKLKYVMYELLTNAIKYTREGGILLTSEANGETVVIQVRDTGRGISAENIPTLFESFEKTNIMNTTQSGMGLGLYVVKKIIDLHHGTITVESTEGKGTVVTVTFPASKLV